MLKNIGSYSLPPLLLLLYISSCTSPNAIFSKQDKDNSSAQIQELARTIHQQALVLDAHADIVTPTTSANFLSADGLSKVDVSKLKKGGVDAVVMSVAVAPGPRTEDGDARARIEANEKLSIVKETIKKDDKVILASSSAAILSAKQNDKLAIVLGFQNARALQKDISAIDSFYKEGIRIFALNHLGHNDFSDSSRPAFNGTTDEYESASEHGGLSSLGRAAIKRINKLGAIVDVTQSSKEATLQTVELSNAPVIASHTNVRVISNVSRNISDEEIDLIGKKDGVVHVSPFRAYLLDYSDHALIAEIKAARRSFGLSEIYSYPFELYWEIEDQTKKYAFLKSISDIIGPADVNDLIDHIDHIVKRVGIDHVGIGTDFNHGSGIDGYTDAADALNVTVGLVKRGYSADDIEKIWGGNFLRVFKEVEQIAVQNRN